MNLAFVSGALMLGLLIVATIFRRYYRQSGERLFVFFSVAFYLMAFERICLELTDPSNEARSFVFLLRLAAFILIIVAIVDKNRASNMRA